MREVIIEVRHHGEPESDVSAEHPDVTLRSVSSMTGSADERKRIIEMSGPAESIEAFLEAFRASDPVVAAEPLSPLTARRVYVAITYEAERWDSISARLTDMGVHYRVGTTIAAGWERWTLYLEPADDLDDVVSSLEAAGNDVRLVRDVPLSDPDERAHLEFSRVVYEELTPRQREVLGTAIDLGYYRPGEDASMEDVAEAVGIASTTAWEHLKRAEDKVMAEVADHLPARP